MLAFMTLDCEIVGGNAGMLKTLLVSVEADGDMAAFGVLDASDASSDDRATLALRSLSLSLLLLLLLLLLSLAPLATSGSASAAPRSNLTYSLNLAAAHSALEQQKKKGDRRRQRRRQQQRRRTIKHETYQKRAQRTIVRRYDCRRPRRGRRMSNSAHAVGKRRRNRRQRAEPAAVASQQTVNTKSENVLARITRSLTCPAVPSTSVQVVRLNLKSCFISINLCAGITTVVCINVKKHCLTKKMNALLAHLFDAGFDVTCDEDNKSITIKLMKDDASIVGLERLATTILNVRSIAAVVLFFVFLCRIFTASHNRNRKLQKTCSTFSCHRLTGKRCSTIRWRPRHRSALPSRA